MSEQQNVSILGQMTQGLVSGLVHQGQVNLVQVFLYQSLKWKFHDQFLKEINMIRLKYGRFFFLQINEQQGGVLIKIY